VLGAGDVSVEAAAEDKADQISACSNASEVAQFQFTPEV
jgi:hypothetical protein